VAPLSFTAPWHPKPRTLFHPQRHFFIFSILVIVILFYRDFIPLGLDTKFFSASLVGVAAEKNAGEREEWQFIRANIKLASSGGIKRYDIIFST